MKKTECRKFRGSVSLTAKMSFKYMYSTVSPIFTETAINLNKVLYIRGIFDMQIKVEGKTLEPIIWQIRSHIRN
jgi:hypothetical protein